MPSIVFRCTPISSLHAADIWRNIVYDWVSDPEHVKNTEFTPNEDVIEAYMCSNTGKIEELVLKLKKDYTIIIVTHNMQQAHRISDKTAFFLMGEVIEYDDTKKIFNKPKNKKTQDYVMGKFG